MRSAVMLTPFLIAFCLSVPGSAQEKSYPSSPILDARNDSSPKKEVSSTLGDIDRLKLFAAFASTKLVKIAEQGVTQRIGWVARSQENLMDVCDCNSGELLKNIDQKNTKNYIGACEKFPWDQFYKSVPAKFKLISLESNKYAKFEALLYEGSGSGVKYIGRSIEGAGGSFKTKSVQVTVPTHPLDAEKINQEKSYYVVVPHSFYADMKEGQNVTVGTDFWDNYKITSLAFDKPVVFNTTDDTQSSKPDDQSGYKLDLTVFDKTGAQSDEELCNKGTNAFAVVKKDFDNALKVYAPQ